MKLLDKLILAQKEPANKAGLIREHAENSDSNINYNNNHDKSDEEGKGFHHFTSRLLQQQESSEISVMASIKQKKGNTGTLLTLTHYSELDGNHHR